MELKIEQGIPIPEAYNKRGSGLTVTCDKMEVGESVFTTKPQSSVYSHFRHLRPKKFTARAVEENGVKGVRVWRVE